MIVGERAKIFAAYQADQQAMPLTGGE